VLLKWYFFSDGCYWLFVAGATLASMTIGYPVFHTLAQSGTCLTKFVMKVTNIYVSVDLSWRGNDLINSVMHFAGGVHFQLDIYFA
jgi:hypothetical protein